MDDSRARFLPFATLCSQSQREIRDDNKRMRKALEHYADKNRWRKSIFYDQHENGWEAAEKALINSPDKK